MANYIVDPVNGDDLDSGTSELTAWQTIAKAVGSGVSTPVVQGDSILLRGGTHNVSSDLVIAASATGASGNPVMFKRYQSEAPLINFTGAGDLRFPVDGSVHYWVFQFIEWQGSFIGQLGEQNSEVNGVVFEDCYGHDIVATGSDNVSLLRLDRFVDYIVRRCRFENIENGGVGGLNATAIKNYSAYNGIVEDCTFKHCMHGGWEQKHGHPSNPANAVEIRRCIFEDIFQGYGVVLAPTATQSAIFGVKIHHCLFDASAFISLHDATSNQGTGLQFYNNTIILPTNNRAILTRGLTQIILHSNIFYSATKAQAISTEDPSSAIWNNGFSELDRNCYWHIENDQQPFPTPGGAAFERDRDGATNADYANLTEWQAATSTATTSFPANHEQNSIEVDPLFATTGFNFDGYKLTANSPCRGAGKDGVDMGWKAFAPIAASNKRVFVF